MEDKIITPASVSGTKTLRFKVKINYDNGSLETIYPVKPPNVNPVTPMLMDFAIKAGYVRHVNIGKVRTMDIEVTEESGIIT